MPVSNDVVPFRVRFGSLRNYWRLKELGGTVVGVISRDVRQGTATRLKDIATIIKTVLWRYIQHDVSGGSDTAYR